MKENDAWCQYQLELFTENNSPEAIAEWRKKMDEAIKSEQK